MKPRDLVLGAVGLIGLMQAAEAQKQKTPRRDREKIVGEEIAERPAARSAYDVIKVLRPQWLTVRGPTTIMQQEISVVVYRDGSKLGSVDELNSIPADQIKEMRHLSPSDATLRYGTDHPRGAIEIDTKR
jgi:hypothetical protein